MKNFTVFLFALSMFGACVDGSDDLKKTDAHSVFVPPNPGNPLDGGASTAVLGAYNDFVAGMPGTKPTISWERARSPQAGPVELVQSRLDTNPGMGNCPNFGAAPGQAWTQVFRYASPNSNAYPSGQPWGCRMLPPNSVYPNLWASSHIYPDVSPMNDNIRAFFVWVAAGSCVRVRFGANPPDWGYGAVLTYQVCGTGGQTAVAWSGNIDSDAGGWLGATSASVEWWYL